MTFASSVGFSTELIDFFDSGLHTCTAVARLTLALAKLSCFAYAAKSGSKVSIPDMMYPNEGRGIGLLRQAPHDV